MKDFRADDGKPQNIEFFTHDEAADRGRLLVDLSTTRASTEDLQDAILSTVWNCTPGDKRYTPPDFYGNTADIAVNTTWDSDKIADKVRKRRGGGAALFDAITWPGAQAGKGALQTAASHHRDGDSHDNANKHNRRGSDWRSATWSRSAVARWRSASNEVQMCWAFDARPAATWNTIELLQERVRLPFQSVGRRQLCVDGGTGGFAAEIQRHHQGPCIGRSHTYSALQTDIDRGKPKQYRKITVISLTPNVKISAREGCPERSSGVFQPDGSNPGCRSDEGPSHEPTGGEMKQTRFTLNGISADKQIG